MPPARRRIGPPPGARGDAEELAHLKAHASLAWQAALPQLQQLARAPLHLSLDAVVRDKVGAPAGTPFEAMVQAFREFFWDLIKAGAIAIDSPNNQCLVNLHAWGNVTGVDQALGLSRKGQWADHATGWQSLAHDTLWPQVAQALWHALAHPASPPSTAAAPLDADTLDALRAQPGRLQAPPIGDIDEVLALALAGLADPAPWLAWLLAAGHGVRLGGALPVLALRLEPERAAANKAGARPPAHRAPQAWVQPHPVLQHWRRLLLLQSLDAGQGLRRRLQASGLWTVLQQPLPGLPPLLQAHWLQVLAAAFGGRGQDLRLRLQAAQWLGQLGDTLRWQWATGVATSPASRKSAGPPTGKPIKRPNQQPVPWPLRQPSHRNVAGLRLHPALWADIGQPGAAPQGFASARRCGGLWATSGRCSPGRCRALGPPCCR